MDIPVIGVTPLYDKTKQSVWMIPGYLGGIEQAGGCPLILPYTEDEKILRRAYEACDGILFTGGPDIDPALYGEPRAEYCGVPDTVRDVLEKQIFKWCLAEDKPVFGICRGIQFFNALLGGKLWQDLPKEHPSNVEHSMTAPYDRGVHAVTFTKNSPLADIFGAESAMVNSYHHQAVKVLAPALVATAVSEDGLVEGAYIPGAKFIHCVQWHPELDYKVNAQSRALFKELIKSSQIFCAGRTQKIS